MRSTPVTSGRSRWTWWLVRLSRRIWFRAALFAVLGIAGALVGVALAPFIPPRLMGDLSAEDVADVLQVLANGMLLVATFSLSTMIMAYSFASNSTTPRVTELLLEDASAQNAVSTFVGGFLFALAGIVGLNAGIYGDRGHLVLFVLTLVAIVIIVVTFLRWVETLSHFGRVPDAISRTERAAAGAIRERLREPWLGGRSLDEADTRVSEVLPETMGYVRNIDVKALQELAEEIDGEVHVLSPPGSFMDGLRPLASLTVEVNDELTQRIRVAFDVGDTRTFDQDPSYGVSALAEIAVKALSPAISDPRTAQRVIDRLIRVLAPCSNSSSVDTPRYDRVFVPPLDVGELYADAFEEIAHYGAADVQVGVRLQQAFRTLATLGPPEAQAAAREQSTRAFERARAALTLPADVRRLEALAAEVTSAVSRAETSAPAAPSGS